MQRELILHVQCSCLITFSLLVEVGRQKDYVEGIFAGFKEINSSFTSKKISICDTRSSQASGVFALNKFLFSDDLRLDKLGINGKRGIHE